MNRYLGVLWVKSAIVTSTDNVRDGGWTGEVGGGRRRDEGGGSASGAASGMV